MYGAIETAILYTAASYVIVMLFNESSYIMIDVARPIATESRVSMVEVHCDLML